MPTFNYESLPDMFLSPGAIKEWWRQTKEQFKIDPEVFKQSVKTTVGNIHWIFIGSLIFNVLVAYLFFKLEPFFIIFMTFVIFPLAAAVIAGGLTLKSTWMEPNFKTKDLVTKDEVMLNQDTRNLTDSPPTTVGREAQ